MPNAEYKHCILCGERFERKPRRSQAQWDNQRFDSRSCSGAWNAKTHGATTKLTKSPEYESWIAMKSRCLNPNATGYADYGGRGITICDRWRSSFEAFLADMGQRPTAHPSTASTLTATTSQATAAGQRPRSKPTTDGKDTEQAKPRTRRPTAWPPTPSPATHSTTPTSPQHQAPP